MGVIKKKRIGKIAGIIIALCMIVLIFIAFNILPVIGKVNIRGIFSDYDYTIMNNEVYLTKYHGDEAKVIIPDKVLFRAVVGIGSKKNNSEVENGTFQGNQKITSVEIPDTVKIVGALSFVDCSNLTDVKLSDNLETIGENAFSHTPITQIVIPESVQYIGNYVFSKCRQLNKVNIGKNVKYIGDAAFGHTPWLEAQTDDFVVVGDGVLLKYFGSSRQIVIPDGVKEICGDAFTEYDKANTGVIFDDVEYVKMPKSVEKIGDFTLKWDGKTKVYFEDEDIDFGYYAIGRYCTIIAPKGSSAEKYAIDNGIKYQNQ